MRVTKLSESSQLFWLFFTITSLVYLILNWCFTVNFVWNYDDVFICIEGFMSYRTGEISLWEYLTTYRNGHPIIMERIFTVLNYWVFGVINIKVILILSSLFPILSSYLINRNMEDDLLKRYITHMLLLSFTNSIYLWASASAVYFFPFFFFSIILLKMIPKNLDYIGLIFYGMILFLMYYSFSNSLVIIPILGSYFILNRIFAETKIDLKKIVVFIIISVLFIRDYYMTTAYYSVDRVTMNDNLFASFNEILGGFKFLLVFSGSFAKYLSFSPYWQTCLASALGLLIFVILVHHFIKNIKNLNPWFWISVYVFLSGAMVTISRFDGTDYYYALDNRYEWFGVINILAIVQIFNPSFNSFKSTKARSGIIMLILGLITLKTGWNTLNLPRYKDHHESRASDFLNQLENKDYEIPFDTPNRALDALKVRPIMEEAQTMGLFEIDPKFYEPRISVK